MYYQTPDFGIQRFSAVNLHVNLNAKDMQFFTEIYYTLQINLTFDRQTDRRTDMRKLSDNYLTIKSILMGSFKLKFMMILQ